ncbi:MAG: glycerophosphodiester phosphodiesterase family protein [Halieaceae bacterium]|nr:glycerophosphodiester phosphodiesterase family protein [Halieaceae bacterium]
MRKTLYCMLGLLFVGCSDGNDSFNAQPPVGPSSLTINTVAVPEGLPGEMTRLVFRATLTEPQPGPVVIDYETVAGSARAGVDYLDVLGSVEIPPGELSADIPIEVLGDAEEEPAETVTLSFTVSENAEPTTTEAVGYIANDDTACDAPYQKADPNRWRVAAGEDPLNYAHRGGVIDFPENTLYAYSEVAALDAGIVLEMDVYQTADDELVIIHDLDVDRTTDGTGLIADLTLAELKQLDAAYWFVPGVGTPRDRPEEDYVFRGIATGQKPPPPGYSADDFRIPTLEEALARYPDRLINLELKPDLDGEGNYEAQMAALLRAYGRYDDLIAASFVDEAANNFKAAAPCVHTSVPLDQGTVLVLGGIGPGVIPPVPEHVAFQVPPDTSQISQIPDSLFIEVVNEDFVADAHNANLAVQVWTINSCEDMLKMMALGVDAIMTDRPVLLQQLLDTPRDQRSCEGL